MIGGVYGMQVINHKRGDCIWYHTTPMSRIKSILKRGLKINSKPTYQEYKEPWIYVSTKPFLDIELITRPFVVLEVDLSWLSPDDCGWPFVDPDTKEWEGRWQLRVFRNISPAFLREMDLQVLADTMERRDIIYKVEMVEVEHG
jgi:hypothetical protein